MLFRRFEQLIDIFRDAPSATTAIQASSRPWSVNTWTLGVPWARSMMVLR